ncbi:MAG TPA: S8 family serine peptidase, partial [Solirubrobacterales bacterium]|nr:S8 family serine peptidase [Solirubrobacterales bacterium]
MGTTLCAAFLVVAASFLWASSASAAKPATDPYIVVLKDDVAHPANVAHRHEENRGAELGHVYGTAIKGYSAELTLAEARAVRSDPTVDYVARAGMTQLAAQTSSTGLRRVGALSNPTLDIDEVDDVQTNVDVAVIDTGIDYDHPDLRVVSRTLCTYYNPETPGKSYCVDGAGDDLLGHGSHVAGIIGAKDNGLGSVGVAPGARLWAVKVTKEAQGNVSDPDLLAGIDWVAARANQIEVANLSIAGKVSESTPGAVSALGKAIATSVNNGVVFVAGAGNWAKDANDYYPANFSDVVTVSAVADYDGQAGSLKGATTCQDTVSPFSSHGDVDDTFWRQFDSNGFEYGSNWGSAVDIAAPGVCIFSAYKNGEYRAMTGTSMAAPHVAGAAAILAAKKNPNTRSEVEGIRTTLRNSGSSNWTD